MSLHAPIQLPLQSPFSTGSWNDRSVLKMTDLRDDVTRLFHQKQPASRTEYIKMDARYSLREDWKLTCASTSGRVSRDDIHWASSLSSAAPSFADFDSRSRRRTRTIVRCRRTTVCCARETLCVRRAHLSNTSRVRAKNWIIFTCFYYYSIRLLLYLT